MNPISDTSNPSNLPDSNDYVFKLVLVGDSGVGKSCILHQFIYSRFKKNTTQTIGVDFSAKNVHIDNQEIKLQIWDTAGQEKFRSVARSYYRGAIGIIIVYDITKAESFQHIASWLADARNAARSECSVCVVGNKADLEEQRMVRTEDGKLFCTENNLLFFECSALSGENVDEIFTAISKHIMNKIENGIIEPNSVISSFAKEMKRVSKENGENNKGQNCGGYAAC